MTDKITKQYDLKKMSIDWVSGLVAGFASVTFCAPLDVARTRMALIVYIFKAI